MKTIATLPAIAALLILTGCDPSSRQQTYTVKIEVSDIYGQPLPDGHPSIFTHGSCATTQNGAITSHDLLALNTEALTYEGASISCTAQAPQELSGTLKMTILRQDGSQVGTSESSQQYGVVSVAGR